MTSCTRRKGKRTHRGNSRHDNRVEHRRQNCVFQMRVLWLLLLQPLLIIVLIVLVARFTPGQGDDNTPNGALYFPVPLERRSGQRLVHICRPGFARAPETSTEPNTVPIMPNSSRARARRGGRGAVHAVLGDRRRRAARSSHRRCLACVTDSPKVPQVIWLLFVVPAKGIRNCRTSSRGSMYSSRLRLSSSGSSFLPTSDRQRS